MFYGDMTAVMIMMVGLRRMGAHTNGAGGLDDGGSADGGRCGHPRFIEKSINSEPPAGNILEVLAPSGLRPLARGSPAAQAPSPLHHGAISPKF